MKRFALLFLAVLVAGTAGPVCAASGPWVTDGPVAGRLISAVNGTDIPAALPLALDVRLEPGWKTYWRTPGDAGLAPQIDWAGSTNLAAATMDYPAPHRFSVQGIETIGYDTEVTLPIRAIPTESGAPLVLKAGVELLVCAEICVPRHLDLALTVPAGPAVAAAEANDVARATARVPGDGQAAGLSVRALHADGAALVVEVEGREPLVDPDVFVESEPPLALRAPLRRFFDGDRRAILRLALAEAPAGFGGLTGREVSVTVVDGARALELRRVVAPAPAGSGGGGLLAMLGVALLGGLILNLMPCVLPVLSLKIVSVVAHGGQAPARVRASFLASAAGIVTSFLAMAAVLVGLKAAGAAVGWGIQFQEPLFLVFMVVLVTLFAANLWGLFEIPLPRLLADSLGGGAGGSGAGRHGLAGPFVTGAFATLLATPCSAPFLGTAVGFALAGGPLDIVAVFTALGLGMALPYLLVAAVPRLAARLPRPGHWMLTLRRILGGVLALTGLWLLSVLASQVGDAAAGAVAALMAAMLVALWWAGRAAVTVAVALALVAFVAPGRLERGAGAAPVAEVGGLWVPFDEAAIGQMVGRGQTVLVDVTADWCITCQANKKLVLNRGPVAARLAARLGGGIDGKGGVVAMRADWTRPDPRIADFLARHGRYGIPFNIVYGPGAPGGLALPELLSDAAVLEALDAAAGHPPS
jgi:suppressor for copper-sensitivity B